MNPSMGLGGGCPAADAPHRTGERKDRKLSAGQCYGAEIKAFLAQFELRGCGA